MVCRLPILALPLALLGLVAYGVPGAGCRSEPAPSTLGEVPGFSLVDQDGRPFGSDQLEDKIWVASFFFTSCRTVCPPLLSSLSSLADRAKEESLELHLVSITVDPVTDTPAVLRKKGVEANADFDRWHFLTGSDEALRDLIVGGFKTLMGEKREIEGGIMDIGHGAQLILIDGQGQVRHHFPSNDRGVDDLLVYARRLAR